MFVDDVRAARHEITTVNASVGDYPMLNIVASCYLYQANYSNINEST